MSRFAGAAFGCVALAAVATFAATPTPDAPAIVVPAAGGVPWTASDIAKLDADIDGIVTTSALPIAHVGVLAVETATGRVLYSRLADDAFAPASTLKLLVGSVALDRLGPDYRPTTVASFGSGSVTIVPDGDPLFGLRDADALAVALQSANVLQLNDVVVRKPAAAAPPYPDGWTFDDFARDYAPPISRATFEENLLHLHVSPGAAASAPATVAMTPALPVLAASEAACSRSGAFLINGATTGEARSENTLDVVALPNGCRELLGSLPRGDAASDIDVAVPDPSLYLAQAAVAAIRAHGIVVRGSGSVASDADDSSDAGSTIFTAPGEPLAELLPRFWIPSDNFVGETLLMHLAPHDGKTPPGENPRERALDVERAWLRSIGVDPATTTLADGSGLSQYDRITPRDLVAILQHDWNGPNRQLVLNALPIGGARGTIEGIERTPAAGRVFAKTGSMKHVRGLAGYLATERHGAVTFAFQVDDWIGEYADLAKVRAAVLTRIVRD